MGWVSEGNGRHRVGFYLWLLNTISEIRSPSESVVCGFSGISISGNGNETETVLRIYFVTRYFAGFSFVDGFPRDV